jgi:hypothetical protein
MSSFSSDNAMMHNNNNINSRDHSFDDAMMMTMDSGGKHEKKHKHKISNKKRFFTIVLVASDCLLIGLQPILVHLTKNSRGGFAYHPVSVNFITEATKVLFAVVFLMVQVSISRYRGVVVSVVRVVSSSRRSRSSLRSLTFLSLFLLSFPF